MATFQQFPHHQRALFESPAKIFAKLKSRVQREAADDVFGDECGAAGLHGAPRTPKRKTTKDSGLQEMFGNGEVTALTLSPISSPAKHNGCGPEDEQLPCMEKEHLLKLHRSPKQRLFMESTAVCDSTTQPPHMDVFLVSEKLAECLDHCDPVDLGDTATVFSPVRNGLRKRKLDEQLMNKANNVLSVMDYVHCQEKERKLSRAFSEDGHCTKLRNVNPVASKHNSQSDVKGCDVEKVPQLPATPAKIFAYLKEMENQRDQCDLQRVTSSTRPNAECGEPLGRTLNNKRYSTLPIENHQKVCEEQPSALPRPQSPDLDKDAPHDPVPQPVVLEDPLVLNSPRVAIPKTQPVLKRNKWPQCTTFPSENVIHLKHWFLRTSHGGLFVDGIRRDNNLQWNSNIITERVSRNVLKTLSGRVYVLVGKMAFDAPSRLPRWFLRSFTHGFPSKWKELYENCLSELKGLKKACKAQRENRNQTLRTPKDQSLQQQKSVKTSESCPSTTSTIQTSRSGRLIKPPLDYWRGGRVILDAYMNVIIHDGYDTVIQPEAKAFFSATPAITTTLAKVPVNDDCKQKESIPQSQPQRKVKATRRKPPKTKSNIIEKPPSPVNHNPTSRVTRSNMKSLAAEKINNEPEPQKPTDKSTDTKKKNTPKPKVTKPKLAKVSPQPSSSQRSSPGDSSSSRARARRRGKENDFKKTEAKRSDKQSQINLSRRSSRSSHSSEENETLQNKPQRKRPKTNEKPRSKTPSPNNPQMATKSEPHLNRTHKRAARGNKRSPVLDEDTWNEEELRKLQEAVSCHPKHFTGYWTKVAMMVGTRSAEECHKQHTSQGASRTPAKREKKSKQKMPVNEKADNPVISARVGTLRRKQQVRDFLEAMPKDDMDDVFSSEYMRSKRCEVPSLCPSDDHDFSMSEHEPLTPRHSGFPEAKTPQCLHITPGMMGSSSRNYDDKYVFQLQKRMKKQYQFNVQKHAPKSFTPSASVKKDMRRRVNTENDTFVVWEMFPDKEAQADSGEEEDFYFSEND